MRDKKRGFHGKRTHVKEGGGTPQPGRTQRPSFRPKFRPETRSQDGLVLLYGWHTVKAALQNPQRRIRKLIATENAIQRLTQDGIALPVEPELVRPDAIAERLPADAVHQGLLAEADPLPAIAIEDVPPHGIVLVFDQITDPHNVGAMLRSAAAFAVKAVVVTSRNSPEATGVLAKSASGALDQVPLVEVGNLAQALMTLKDNGFFLIGLDSDGSVDLASAPLQAPLALVLGAEGKGLRHLTRTHCDVLARLDLPGSIKSLNVSNAAAVALYVTMTRLSPT